LANFFQHFLLSRGVIVAIADENILEGTSFPLNNINTTENSDTVAFAHRGEVENCPFF